MFSYLRPFTWTQAPHHIFTWVLFDKLHFQLFHSTVAEIIFKKHCKYTSGNTHVKMHIWLSSRPLVSFYERASIIPSRKGAPTWKKKVTKSEFKKRKILLLGHNLQRFGKRSDGAVVISYFMSLASSAFLDVHSEYLIPPLDAPWLAPPVQPKQEREVMP